MPCQVRHVYLSTLFFGTSTSQHILYKGVHTVYYIVDTETKRSITQRLCHLKVHKIEIFFGFDFEIYIISLLVMWKY
jgi:hypothetical protein